MRYSKPFASDVMPLKQRGEPMSDPLQKLQHRLEAAQRALAGAESRCTRQAAEHRDALEASENARRQAEQELKLLRTLLDNSSDAIEVIDPVSFRFLDVNETECRELGYSREELLSLHIFDIDPEFSEVAAKHIEEELNQVSGVRFDSVHRRKDGSTFPVEVSAKQVKTDRPYLFCIARDISVRKLLESERQINEKRLLLAIQCGQMGVWELDLVDHTANTSLELGHIFGYTSQESEWSFKLFLEHVLPEDRSEVSRLFHEAIARQTDWHCECRIRRTDGELRWITVRGRHWHDSEGVVQRMIGIVQDITERKLAVQAVIASERRFRNLVESLSDWVWEVDEQGRYIYCSPNVRDLLGYEPAELIGKSPLELMPAAEAARVAEIFGTALSERSHLKDLVNINLHKDGHEVVMETSGAPVVDADGTFRGYRGIDRDITDRKELERELESQARTDVLTGLNNRRYFFELAELELARAKRHGNQFSLLMLDVDHFKLFNDSYGHHIGDRVLQKLSEVCMHTLREIDLSGRIGGEEFAIMLPETRGDRAMEVAERLRLAIAGAPVLLEQQSTFVHFTVSIGVTSLVAADRQVDDLLKRADDALYAAKNAGRNQVCKKDES